MLPKLNPEVPGIQKRSVDCANDLAWFLIDVSDPAVKNPLLTVDLAIQATRAYPENVAYCNML